MKYLHSQIKGKVNGQNTNRNLQMKYKYTHNFAAASLDVSILIYHIFTEHNQNLNNTFFLKTSFLNEWLH